ncbi:MAG TPA: hypothetical protein VIH79_04270 [Candidatus Nanopelagicaceae bacterium]
MLHKPVMSPKSVMSHEPKKFWATHFSFSRSSCRDGKSLWESSLAKRTSKSSALIVSGLLVAATVGLSACGAATYTEARGLPNTKLTPGAINPSVTQANIKTTICVIGWTATVRPPATYTNHLKYAQLHSGYNLGGDLNLKDYEEDHIVPLETGGNPSSTLNLFPEPRNIKYGSYLKDQLENQMHQLVCSGQVSLKTAQSVFLTNWEKGYVKYVGRLP